MTILKKNHFTSEEIFQKEKDLIFNSNWQAVAFTFDIPKNNDYVLKKIGDQEVIIQNIDGDIFAFTNVCPHRLAAIHTSDKGNAPLVCKYHLWSFDKHGNAKAPLASEKDRCIVQEKKLQAWQVDICGTLIFVSKKPPTKNLRNYLGNSWSYLETITNNLGLEFEGFNDTINANWKVIIQNTIEFYHAFSTHPNTFAPLLASNKEIAQDHLASEPHIRYHVNFKESGENLDEFMEKHFILPEVTVRDSFDYMLIFPLMTVGSVNCRDFTFFRYTPISATQTKLEVRSWLPKFKNPDKAPTNKARILTKITQPFFKKLSDEDKEICEIAQRGINSSDDNLIPAFLESESLVKKFRNIYARKMNLNNDTIA